MSSYHIDGKTRSKLKSSLYVFTILL